MERSKIILAILASIAVVTMISSISKPDNSWTWMGTDVVAPNSLYNKVKISKLHPGVESIKVVVEEGDVSLTRVKINYLKGDNKLIHVNASLSEKDQLEWTCLTSNKRLVESVELWYGSTADQLNRVHLYGK